MRVIPLLGKLGKIESKNEELRMETTSLTTTRHAAQMLIFVISKINRTFQRLPLLHHTCNNVFSLPLFCICRLKIIRANNQKIELNPFEWRKYETLGLGYSISTISKLQMNTHSFSIKISIAINRLNTIVPHFFPLSFICITCECHICKVPTAKDIKFIF